MKKSYLSVLSIAVAFILCITLTSCTSTPEAPDNSSSNTTSNSTPTIPGTDVPNTSDSESSDTNQDNEPIDPVKNQVVSSASDYSCRFGDRYLVYVEKNEDGNPLNEAYHLFITMGLEFTVRYTYKADGSLRSAFVDINKPGIPDDSVIIERNEDETVSKLLRYRPNVEKPIHETVFERDTNGKIVKEIYYNYGLETGYAEFNDLGVKTKESAKLNTAQAGLYEKVNAARLERGLYEMTYTYTSYGSVETVKSTGFTYDKDTFQADKNYFETLTFTYADGNPSHPDDFEITATAPWNRAIRERFKIEHDENGHVTDYWVESFSRTYEYIYDQNGIQYLDKLTVGDRNSAVTQNFYDDNFRLSETKYSSYSVVYKYNDEGQLNEEVYTSYSNPDTPMKTVTYQYKNGYVSSITTVSDQSTSVAEYNEYGNIISKRSDTTTYEYIYDEHNFCIKYISTTNEDRYEQEFEYTDHGFILRGRSFDKDGNLLSEVVQLTGRNTEGEFGTMVIG